MCGGGGSKSAANAAAQQQADQAALAEKQRQEDAAREAARQATIQQGTNAVNTQFDNTFTNDFFNNLSKQYVDTYSPQLKDQFTQARKTLAYQLADRGLTNSSVAADQYGQLQDKYNQTQQSIQDKGLQTSNNLKAQVANTKGNLINQVNSGADLNTINSLVASNLGTLQAPQTYDPLGQIFTQLLTSGGSALLQNSGALNTTRGSVGPNVSGATGGTGVKVY